VTIETNLDNDAVSTCLRVGTRRAASRSPCDGRRCGRTRVLDRSVSGDGWCGHAQHAGGAGSKPDVSTSTTTKSLAAFISSALLPAPTRLRVLLAHRGFAHLRQGAGCRRSGCREACGGTSRFGGPVDCYQIVTGELSDFPLPSFVTFPCRAVGILVCTPPLRGRSRQSRGGRHGSEAPGRQAFYRWAGGFNGPRSAESEILRISSCPANWRLSMFAEVAALVTQGCRRGAAGRARRPPGTPRR